jgi:hypothetical protein
MNFAEFADSIKTKENPMILLEGTRGLPEADRSLMIRLGEKLVRLLPNAIFRSGNAPGTDAAFSEGVQNIDASRMEHLVPYPGHRKRNALQPVKTVAFDEVPEDEKQEIIQRTIQASPDYRGLVNLYIKNRGWSRHTAKLLYLLRDTLKVIGSRSLKLAPATCGIFYVSESEPLSGGTGHTIRVCQQNRLTVIDQSVWRDWISR